MPVLNADFAAKAQWDYLITTLRAAAVPNGKLDGITYVGKGYQLWTQDPPSIGVQLRKVVKGTGSTTRRLMTTTFWIVVGVQSTEATAAANMGAGTPPNLEDANIMLEKYVGDGSGNGIIPILDDQANYTLGGNAMKCLTGDVIYDWQIEPGEPPEIWAYAQLTLTAENLVFI